MAIRILQKYEPHGSVRAIVAKLQQLLHEYGDGIELVPSPEGTFVVQHTALTAEQTRERKRQRSATQKIEREKRLRNHYIEMKRDMYGLPSATATNVEKEEKDETENTA